MPQEQHYLPLNNTPPQTSLENQPPIYRHFQPTHCDVFHLLWQRHVTAHVDHMDENY